MTRLIAATALAAALGGLTSATVSTTLAANGGQTCVGGDNQHRPGYGMGLCVDTIDTNRL